MLTAHGLSKSYSLTTLLNHITLSIQPGDRVGLIGPNGSGKTTLMRLLAGVETPDVGQVIRTPSDLRVGYLAQGFEPGPGLTIGDLIHRAGGDQARLEAELSEAAAALAVAPDDAAHQQAYQQALDRLAYLDSGQAERLLAGLGLGELSPGTPAAELSGGQKTRLALALVLLGSPQLLLLDEPTNHLDIGMLDWLETWLVGFDGAALIVSHDRAFLDRTVDRILDLDPLTGRIQEYSGNYSDYLDQYRRQHDKQWAAWRDQEYEIRRMKQDIARTMEQANHVERTTHANQPGVRRIAKKVARKAKSREKKLDRYVESEDRVEKPPLVWQMKLEFDDGAHIGRDVLRLVDLAVGYEPGRPLLRDLNLAIQAGQRVVLAGANGTGKTTLMRTIAGLLPPLRGQVRLGASVRLGYMSQEQELLDPAATPLRTIQAAAPMSETEARSFLHYFLFEGDEALQPNGQLSYGERARLALARLVAEGCTFLLLDEPINHLDIPSRARFEQALGQFPGTILAVVHDRYFIERFATDIWTVDEGGIVTEVWETAD
jgi:ATP-binding cassette subfamily F protein 3